MAKRRNFGTIRKLPSGRYQASYVAPDDIRYNGPRTFQTKTDASAWLSSIDVDISRGLWVSPKSEAKRATSMQKLSDYLESHIELQITFNGQPIQESTKETYRRIAKNHLGELAEMPINQIRKTDIDNWFSKLAKTGKSTTAGKAYTLVSTVMKRAVDDDLISKNPCSIKGARTASSNKKIDIPTPREIAKILDAINPRLRLLIILQAFGGLRWGEVTALTRKDLYKVLVGTDEVYEIDVNKAVKFVQGAFVLGAPKTQYSIRTVQLSSELTGLIDRELASQPSLDTNSLIVKGEKTEFLRHDVFANNWRRALKRAGLSDRKLTGHGLRHYAGTYFAKAGGNLPEIKKWIGDNSTVAVARYLHSTDRANTIANQMEIDYAVMEPELLK